MNNKYNNRTQDYTLKMGSVNLGNRGTNSTDDILNKHNNVRKK